MAEDKKVVIYQKIVATLEPEIAKLKDFMYFHQKSVKCFCSYVTQIGALKEDPPSGSYDCLHACSCLCLFLCLHDEMFTIVHFSSIEQTTPT